MRRTVLYGSDIVCAKSVQEVSKYQISICGDTYAVVEMRTAKQVYVGIIPDDVIQLHDMEAWIENDLKAKGWDLNDFYDSRVKTEGL